MFRARSWTLGLAALGLYVGATGAGVVAAVQLEHIDPVHKAGNLAILTSFGALFAMISTPLWGALSDRVRSRWGRRNPVAFVGAFLIVISLTGMALSTTVVELGIALVRRRGVHRVRAGAAVRGHPRPHPRTGSRVRVRHSRARRHGGNRDRLGRRRFPCRLEHCARGYAVLAVIILVALLLFVLLNPDESIEGRPAARLLGSALHAFVLGESASNTRTSPGSSSGARSCSSATRP